MDLAELKQQQAELRSEILERLLFLHHPDLAPSGSWPRMTRAARP